MKAIHAIHGLGKRLGGPTTCVYQLAKGLNAIGVDTEIVTHRSRIENDDIAADSFIRYLDSDLVPPLGWSKSMRRYLRASVADCDVVHGNVLWMWTSHEAKIAARRGGKPFVLSPHGMLYRQALRVSAWKKRLMLGAYQRADLEGADMLHACSLQELETIRDFGIRVPVAVVPNCLEIGQAPQMRAEANSIRRVGFVGRLHPIKNIDRLLQAWAGLRPADCVLEIIGSGDDSYEQELKAFVAENRLDNVEFKGFLSGEALKAEIARLDYLALPSQSENFGMVVAEALLMGVPAIASRGTPWNVLEDSHCGWWVDVADLAEALRCALALPEGDRRAMGANGQRLVLEKYEMTRVAAQMRDAYAWLSAGAPKPDFVYD